MHRLLPFLLALLLLGARSPLHAQTSPLGTLGLLTAGPYQSNAQGLLTGAYVAGQPLATTIRYRNDSATTQDSLAFTAQVLGNGYVQGLQGFFGRRQAALAPGALASYPLGNIELPGPGSYLVQVAAFSYDRASKVWGNGPVRVYWLFPLAQPLPVELVRFTATTTSDSVRLAWETASELNCRGFEVQRSGNGASFQSLVFVPGNGSSAVGHGYRAHDVRPRLLTYYRLRQLDLDGDEHFSPAVAVVPGSPTTSVTAYPNPASGRAQLSAVTAGQLVRFYDETGRLRRQQRLDETGELDLRELPAGSYHLTVGEGREAAHTRLTIL